MTKIINLTLTDAATGTWIAAGITVAIGVTIPENHDYGQVAEALLPHIEKWLEQFHTNGFRADGMVWCFDPGATDLMGAPSTEPVCQFRILNGSVEAQV